MVYIPRYLNDGLLFFVFLLQSQRNLEMSLVKQTIYSVQVRFTNKSWGFESPHSWCLLQTILSNSYQQILANVKRIQRGLKFIELLWIERLPRHRSKRKFPWVVSHIASSKIHTLAQTTITIRHLIFDEAMPQFSILALATYSQEFGSFKLFFKNVWIFNNV